MKIFAVDTALGACSAAVVADGRVLARVFEPMERGHAEALAPMAAKTIGDAHLSLDEIDRLAVTTGPGTFTGQRVGLAFMRALALALDRPLIGITTTAVLAFEACEILTTRWAISASDARRGEIYSGASLANGEVLSEPVLIKLSDAVGLFAPWVEKFGPPALAGTASPDLAAAFRAVGIDAQDSSVRQPDAVFVARLAIGATPSASAPRPVYLRPPDAKLPLPKKRTIVS